MGAKSQRRQLVGWPDRMDFEVVIWPIRLFDWMHRPKKGRKYRFHSQDDQTAEGPVGWLGHWARGQNGDVGEVVTTFGWFSDSNRVMATFLLLTRRSTVSASRTSFRTWRSASKAASSAVGSVGCNTQRIIPFELGHTLSGLGLEGGVGDLER